MTSPTLSSGSLPQTARYAANLLERYRSAGYRFALSFTEDPAEAEGVVHDTCRLMLRSAARRGVPKEFQGWFFRVLVNVAHNRRRGVRQVTPPRRAFHRLGVHPPHEVGETKWLRTALAELRPELRTALTLRHLVGLSESELAAVLGCNEEGVTHLVQQGLASLQESRPPCSVGTLGSLLLLERLRLRGDALEPVGD